MSRAEQYRNDQDALERYLSAPIPTPPTVPPYKKCQNSGGFHDHCFRPEFQPSVCQNCHKTKAEIAAIEREYERRLLKESA